MKAVIWLVLIFTVFSASLKAQINASSQSAESTKKQEDKFFKKENFVIGSGFGLSIGNVFTSINISPEVGYHLLSDRIVVGGRFYYDYFVDRSNRQKTYRYNIIGGGPFIRGYIWKGIVAHVEYSSTLIKDLPFTVGVYDSTQSLVGYSTIYKDLRLNDFLVGGGYHENFQSGLGFYFLVLFNTVRTNEWLNPNPHFRTGFTYTFKKQ